MSARVQPMSARAACRWDHLVPARWVAIGHLAGYGKDGGNTSPTSCASTSAFGCAITSSQHPQTLNPSAPRRAVGQSSERRNLFYGFSNIVSNIECHVSCHTCVVKSTVCLLRSFIIFPNVITICL